MHDPSTLAWDIKNPFVRDEYGQRPSLITIWHIDPETDYSDDSCDWSYRRFTPEETQAMFSLRDDQFDNLQAYFEGLDPRNVETILKAQWGMARRFYNVRPWYKHPRWHIHHWRFQVHPYERLIRRLFHRCENCGQSFKGTSPVSINGKLYHHGCYPVQSGQERGEVM